MSVYIKGMEMPTCCRYCACYHKKYDSGYYDYDLCLASRTIFNDGYDKSENRIVMSPFEKRLDNCPLIPVPEHGMLCDVDVICKGCRRTAEEFDGIYPDCTYCPIHLAPTIIPEDKEGDE